MINNKRKLSPKKKLPIKKEEIEKVVATATVSKYSGILPPPELLAKYNNAYDGCARDIVDMAKKQQEARISHETKMVDHSIKSSILGTWLGFIVSMFIVVFIFIAAIKRNTMEILWAQVIPVLGAAINRYFSYLTRKKELESKQSNQLKNSNQRVMHGNEPSNEPSDVIDVQSK
jgi:uncharacterized membrane protein